MRRIILSMHFELILMRKKPFQLKLATQSKHMEISQAELSDILNSHSYNTSFSQYFVYSIILLKSFTTIVFI